MLPLPKPVPLLKLFLKSKPYWTAKSSQVFWQRCLVPCSSELFPVRERYFPCFIIHSMDMANQRLAKMLSTVFGAIGNGNVPTSISELLTSRNYNLRGDAILKLPKVNSTKYGIKSWRYQAARLWNTIPNNLRNISDSYRSFKRGLKELVPFAV